MPTMNDSSPLRTVPCSKWTLASSSPAKAKIVLKRKISMISTSPMDCLDQDRIPTQSSANGADDDENLFVRIKRWRHSLGNEPLGGSFERRACSEMVLAPWLQPSPRDSGIDVGSPIHHDDDCNVEPSFTYVDVQTTEVTSPTDFNMEEDCIIVEEDNLSSNTSELIYRTRLHSDKNESTVSPRCLFTLPGGEMRFLSSRHSEDCFQTKPLIPDSFQPISISSSETSCITKPSNRNSVETIGRSFSQTSCIRKPSSRNSVETIGRSFSETSCITKPLNHSSVDTISRSSSETSFVTTLDEQSTPRNWAKELSCLSDVEVDQRPERNLFEFISPAPEERINDIVSSFNKASIDNVTTSRSNHSLNSWKSKFKLNSHSPVSSDEIELKSVSVKNGLINKQLPNVINSDIIKTPASVKLPLPQVTSVCVANDLKPPSANFVGVFEQFLSSNSVSPRHHCESASMSNVHSNERIEFKPLFFSSATKRKKRSSPSKKLSHRKLPLNCTSQSKERDNFKNGSSGLILDDVLPSSCSVLMTTTEDSPRHNTSRPKTSSLIRRKFSASFYNKTCQNSDVAEVSSGLILDDMLPSSCSVLMATTEDSPRHNTSCSGTSLLIRRKFSASFYNKTCKNSDVAVISSLTKCMKQKSGDEQVGSALPASMQTVLAKDARVVTDSIRPGSGSVTKQIVTDNCQQITNCRTELLLTEHQIETSRKCRKQMSVESKNVSGFSCDKERFSTKNEELTITDCAVVMETDSVGNLCTENMNSKSKRTVIENSKGSEIVRKRASQACENVSRKRINRRASPELCRMRRHSSKSEHAEIDCEPKRKTARKPHPNTRYGNDWTLNDDWPDETQVPEVPNKKRCPKDAHWKNSRGKLVSNDVKSTVWQYELLYRLRLRVLQILERLLPTYSVFPAVMPAEYSPAVDRLVDDIIDVLSDVPRRRTNDLDTQLQPRIVLCLSPERCAVNLRLKLIRLLQLLLPDLDLTGISYDQVDQLVDSVISANDDDTCL